MLSEPDISSFAFGVVVPIPTLPAELITSLVFWFVPATSAVISENPEFVNPDIPVLNIVCPPSLFTILIWEVDVDNAPNVVNLEKGVVVPIPT